MKAGMIIIFFINFLTVYIYPTYMYRLNPATSLRNQRMIFLAFFAFILGFLTIIPIIATMLEEALHIIL